ncbi:MAG: dTMP kinase [Deltaproteobacteria bacterium]|nr:dTMP kinase [Deltaproteobacteria bacterium]
MKHTMDVSGGKRGYFITLEGIDGTGKSTQAQLLARSLVSRGHTVCSTREPGGTLIGSRLREVLLHPDSRDMVPVTELLLFLADRVQHLTQVIRPALARGEVVLCDRYHDATLAYQQYARGLDMTPLKDFLGAEIDSTPPDITFWLDMPLEQSMARMALRDKRLGQTNGGDEGRLETEREGFMARVQAGYRELAQLHPDRILRVDAAQPAEAVAGELLTALATRMPGF